jgi:L-lactate dehydrogenase complex protein LldG
MLDRFIAKAKLAGAETAPVSGPEAAAAFIADFLKKNGLKTAIISPDLKIRPPFEAAFAGVGTALPPGALWVDAGIVSADYGIAETGTLVHFDGSDDEKNAWTLPEVCLCVLDAVKIVPALEAIAAEISAHLGRTDVASPQVSLVTGPSRTADVENQLTIGVHGPSRLIIVLA